MGDTMSSGEKAYRLFMALPGGLLGPETQLVMLQNKMNERLGNRGPAFIRIEDASDLKKLPEEAAQAVIAIIHTLGQTAPPKPEDIAALL